MVRLLLHGRSHLTAAKLKQASARSNLSTFSELYLSYFQFDNSSDQTREIIALLLKIIRHKPKDHPWQCIKFQNCGGADLPQILTLIASTSRCHTILWQNATLRSSEAEALADGLCQRKLQRLEIRGVVRMSAATVRALGRASGSLDTLVVSSHRTLVEQKCGDAVLDLQACQALAETLHHKLCEFELLETNLSDDGLACIVAALGSSLRRLNLRGNDVGPQTQRALHGILQSRSFEELELSRSSTQLSLSHLRPTCENAVALRSLSLSGNPLRSTQLEELHRLTMDPRFARLQVLDLSHCDIAQDDLPVMSQIIACSKTLKAINLSGQQAFSPYGVDGLVVAVSKNLSLRCLALPDFVPDSEYHRIEAYLQRNAVDEENRTPVNVAKSKKKAAPVARTKLVLRDRNRL